VRKKRRGIQDTGEEGECVINSEESACAHTMPKHERISPLSRGFRKRSLTYKRQQSNEQDTKRFKVAKEEHLETFKYNIKILNGKKTFQTD
jgi:hypothetical protein